MKRLFYLLALSAYFLVCQKQQPGYQLFAQVQSDVPSPAEGPQQEIRNTPTPTNKATTAKPVESITPQPETSVTFTETPNLSPATTPTPAISFSPRAATAQTPGLSEKPAATATPHLRLNPLSTGTPFPQASVAPTVPARTASQAQESAKPAASTPTTSSWIRNASGKKRTKPAVSPSPSP
jgi:hypothetical protein